MSHTSKHISDLGSLNARINNLRMFILPSVSKFSTLFLEKQLQISVQNYSLSQLLHFAGLSELGDKEMCCFSMSDFEFLKSLLLSCFHC